ncbi:MAG: serine/threonine-protein kinase [Myxococcota bacterium]
MSSSPDEAAGEPEIPSLPVGPELAEARAEHLASLSGGEARALSMLRANLFGGGKRTHIGRYTLKRTLGEGGMGVVYAAHDPRLDREVAIKVVRLRSGKRGEKAEARLRIEARSLARLSDPHIVALYDIDSYEGDANSRGHRSVFLVMELVPGQALGAWRDTTKPTLRERLAVLVQVAHGLAAAHRVGLVHRDVKPSNIIVGEDGRARLLDFGLAQLGLDPSRSHDASSAGHSSDSEADSITATGALLGTPRYMAPEQHAASVATPATDQYGFCLTAFELLFDRPAYAAKTMQALALLKQEANPRPPANPAMLPLFRVLVRGLATRPSERWPELRSLSDALMRAARPKRWPRWVGAGAVAALTITWAATGDATSRCAEGSLANSWARDATAVNERLVAGSIDPALAQHFADFAHAWDTVDHETCLAATDDDGRADEQRWCLAIMRSEFESLVGALAIAPTAAVRSLAGAATNLPAPDHCRDPAPTDPRIAVRRTPATEAIRARTAEVRTLVRAARYDEAVDLGMRTVAAARNEANVVLEAEARYQLGRAHETAGHPTAAQHELEAAYLLASQIGHDEFMAYAAASLAVVLAYRTQAIDDANQWIERAAAVASRAATPRPRYQVALSRASLLHRQGRYAEALAAFATASELAESLFGRDSHASILARSNHAVALGQSGDTEAALAALRALLPESRALFGDDAPQHAIALQNLGSMLNLAGRADEGIDVLKEALAIVVRTHDPNSERVGQAHNDVASALTAMGQHEQAAPHAREAVAAFRRANGDGHPNVGMALGNLGLALEHAGNAAEARAALTEALEIYELRFGGEHPLTSVFRDGLRRLDEPPSGQ